MMKLLLGIVAGVIVCFATVFLVEWIGHRVFPVPGGMPTDPEAMKAAIAKLPTATLVAVVVAWTLGALAGTVTANRIAGRALAGWIVVALLVAATIANLVMFPHPVWMAACGVLVPIVVAWLVQRAMRLPF